MDDRNIIEILERHQDSEMERTGFQQTTAEELGRHDHGKDEPEMLPHTMENIWAKIIYLLEENVRKYLHNLG